MATLNISVDKTVVKFTDKFTYTIDASFSGMSEEITDAVVTSLIPNYIEYTLPAITGPLKDIEVEELAEGDLVKFKFGEITDTGVAVAINLSASFKLGTDTGTVFPNEVNMYINNSETPEQTATSEDVVLQVNEDFYIEKELAIPQSSPAAGGRLIYTINLRNRLQSQGGNGDLGAKIKNVIITDTLPEQLSLDIYPVIGRDKSRKAFADTRYDDLEAVVDGQNITFTLPEYYGEYYEIVVVCKVNEDVELDTEVINTANLSIEGADRQPATETFEVGEAVYLAQITKYVPDYSRVGGSTSYDIRVTNNGNQNLDNFKIVDTVADEVELISINTGSFKIDVIDDLIPLEQDIYYYVNGNVDEASRVLLGTYRMDTSELVVLPDLGDDKITRLEWVLPTLSVGAVPAQAITMNGIIPENTPEGEMVNTAQIIWFEGETERESTSEETTGINNTSVLNISKSVVGKSTDVIPGDIITYSIYVNGNESPIDNPIIGDKLPEQLEYVGNEVYVYYDYFENKSYRSDVDNEFFDRIGKTEEEIKEVVENYDAEGRTLVRYDFDGFILRQRGFLSIEYQSKVKIGAEGDIINNAIIGNKGIDAVIGTNQIEYKDADDIDKDGFTEEGIVQSRPTNVNIAYFAYLTTDKKVKGALDEEYTEVPEVGETYEGGAIDYKFEMKNIGNLNFNYIEMIDIFPHKGDTGVILVDKKRESEFEVYNIGNISASIKEDGKVVGESNLVILYSQSYDPVRFAQTNNGDDVIGTVDDWSTTAPKDITTVKAIKVIFQGELKPNQYIEMNINALAPFGVEVDTVAWNSFAVKTSYINEEGVTKQLTPVEPEKVGIKVLQSNKASISGMIWKDDNKDGNIDVDEIGLNNVRVLLLSENKDIIASTLTLSDINSNPGHYVFNNIDVGNYYIKVIPPTNLYYTKHNEETQNKIDTNTGESEVIAISSLDDKILNIDGGLIEELNFVLRLIEILENHLYEIDCENEDFGEALNEVIRLLVALSEDIEAYLQEELESGNSTDMGYLSQVNRFVMAIKAMLSKLRYIVIPSGYCNTEILAHIVVMVIEYVLQMVVTLELHQGLIIDYQMCGCVGSTFYEILVGKFVNEVSVLSGLSYAFNEVLGILYAQVHSKTYVSAYSPKAPIVLPQMQPQQICCAPCPPHIQQPMTRVRTGGCSSCR